MPVDISRKDESSSEQLTGKAKLERLRAPQWRGQSKEARIQQAKAALQSLGLNYGFDVETWRYFAQDPNLEGY